MEFEFTASVLVTEEDLNEMVERYKDGEILLDVIDSVMAKYDDFEYYSLDYYIDKIEAEVIRRANQK